MIDGESFEAAIGDVDSVLGRRLSLSANTSSSLLHLMDLAWRFSDARTLNKAAPSLKRAFLDYLSLAALFTKISIHDEATSGADAPSAGQHCRARVKGFIDAHFRDPDLTIGTVAGVLGVSVRTVQSAFAQTSETASQYLRHQRLSAAAEMLRGIKTQRSSVTTIAYACGFNSASHFATEFHRAFAMSPTAFRRAEQVLDEVQMRRRD